MFSAILLSFAQGSGWDQPLCVMTKLPASFHWPASRFYVLPPLSSPDPSPFCESMWDETDFVIYLMTSTTTDMLAIFYCHNDDSSSWKPYDTDGCVFCEEHSLCLHPILVARPSVYIRNINVYLGRGEPLICFRHTFFTLNNEQWGFFALRLLGLNRHCKKKPQGHYFHQVFKC